MEQPIVGFHKDVDDHWVAKLMCGHQQHVRHDPPWSIREWTQTESGRKSMIGFELNCVKCDEGAPPDWVFKTTAPAASVVQLEKTNTILYCHRWSETVKFYRDLLALPVSLETDWFVEFLLTDGSFVSIADAKRASIEAVDGQGITLSWQTRQIDQIQMLIRSLGVVSTDIQTKWNSRLFYFHDPEGHRIEFWEPQSGP